MRAPLLFLLATTVAQAQTPELVTDRPDFTESGLAVPPGHVQVESGLTWMRDGEAAALSGPELLLRYTPLPRFELRLGAPDYVTTDAVSGWGDASVGAKVQFGPAVGWDLAVIAATSLPMGDDAFGSRNLEPEVLLAAGRTLGPHVDLGVQVSGTWASDGLLLGATFVGGTGLTDRLGVFLELALETPEAGAGALLLHHGYTFALTPAVQLDVHGALGLTEAAPGVLLGAGLSVRR